MRPCGIIVLLSELFSTESKSQVYASLHATTSFSFYYTFAIFITEEKNLSFAIAIICDLHK